MRGPARPARRWHALCRVSPELHNKYLSCEYQSTVSVPARKQLVKSFFFQ